MNNAKGPGSRSMPDDHYFDTFLNSKAKLRFPVIKSYAIAELRHFLSQALEQEDIRNEPAIWTQARMLYNAIRDRLVETNLNSEAENGSICDQNSDPTRARQKLIEWIISSLHLADELGESLTAIRLNDALAELTGEAIAERVTRDQEGSSPQ